MFDKAKICCSTLLFMQADMRETRCAGEQRVRKVQANRRQKRKRENQRHAKGQARGKERAAR